MGFLQNLLIHMYRQIAADSTNEGFFLISE